MTFRPCRPLLGPSSCHGITVKFRSGIPVDYLIPVWSPIQLTIGFFLTNFPSPGVIPKTYLCNFLLKTVSSLTEKLKFRSNIPNSSTLIPHPAYLGNHITPFSNVRVPANILLLAGFFFRERFRFVRLYPGSIYPSVQPYSLEIL